MRQHRFHIPVLAGIALFTSLARAEGLDIASLMAGGLGGSSSSSSSSTPAYGGAAGYGSSSGKGGGKALQQCLDSCTEATCFYGCIGADLSTTGLAEAQAKLARSQAEADTLASDVASGGYKNDKDPFRAAFVTRQYQDDKAAYDKAVDSAVALFATKLQQLAVAEQKKEEEKNDAFFNNIISVLMQDGK